MLSTYFMLYSIYFFFVNNRHAKFCTQVGKQPRHANICLRASLYGGLSKSNKIF